ncbi:hypothetical protein ACFL4G_00680 [Thermodesulfobacteriota bacterium]
MQSGTDKIVTDNFKTSRPTGLVATPGMLIWLWAILFHFLSVPSSHAVELWSSEDGGQYYALDTALKWTSLLSHAPEDEILYPEHWSAAMLWRLRLGLRARPLHWLNVEVSYEQRARNESENPGLGGGTGIFLQDMQAPFRISQVDEPLVEIGETFTYRHELDRASVALKMGRAEVIIGRQAVGWGRGVLFGAVDIFAPFTPLESDREWRRGIDAVRAGLPLTDHVSLDVVYAAGESWEASALVGRLHGYFGNVDGEIIFGKRYEDYLYAASASLPVWDAEMHGEIAFFHTPEAIPGGGVFGTDDLVMKALVGGSYSLMAGRQVLVIAEYHFSGFGVNDIEDLALYMLDEAYLERAMRGDSQILGRHAGALQITYGTDGTIPVSLSWIVSPIDWSGVLTAGVTWIFSDNVTFTASAYFPHGAEPENGTLQSEYGATPVSGLLQVSFYY